MGKVKYIVMLLIIWINFNCNITEAAENSSYTNSNIKLSPNTSEKNIVNPLNPYEKIVVVDNLNKKIMLKHGPEGSLTIDYVSNFKFKDIYASNKDISVSAIPQEAYDSKNKRIQIPNFIQVSDTRGINGSWQVTVKQISNMITNSSKYPELKGATFSLNNIKHTTTGSFKVKTKSHIILTLGEEQVVMHANSGEGSGTNIVYWDSENVQLNIPGSIAKLNKKYYSELIWSISDTPN